MAVSYLHATIELTGLVCVHNFVLWFFSYETETVLHTCTHSHT